MLRCGMYIHLQIQAQRVELIRTLNAKG